MICIIQTMFMKPQTMFLPIQTVSQVIKTVSKVIKIVIVKLLFLEGTTVEQNLRKQAIINSSKRKGKELNLLISLSYRHKKTTLKRWSSAQNRNRTCTSLRTADFESAASTNSAIWAFLNWGANIGVQFEITNLFTIIFYFLFAN